MENFNTLVSGGIAEEDLVGDGWTEIIRNLLLMIREEGAPELTPEQLVEKMELADFQKMEQIRARVDSLIEDPQVAEALKPYYRQFCKRPCFHDEYLDTFNLPGVQLVDTQGKGVDRITEKGIIANGVEYEIDCLIFATGFEVGTDYTRRSGYDLIGRDDVSLGAKWAEGLSTFHGMHTRGFPNCFIISQSQSAFTANFPHAMSEQAVHIAHILKHCLDTNVRTIEASQAAEDTWVETIIGLARFGQDFLESCTPGYYNNEGQPDPESVRNGFYGGGSIAFFRLLQEWRDAGEFAGLEFIWENPS